MTHVGMAVRVERRRRLCPVYQPTVQPQKSSLVCVFDVVSGSDSHPRMTGPDALLWLRATSDCSTHAAITRHKRVRHGPTKSLPTTPFDMPYEIKVRILASAVKLRGSFAGVARSTSGALGVCGCAPRTTPGCRGLHSVVLPAPHTGLMCDLPVGRTPGRRSCLRRCEAGGRGGSAGSASRTPPAPVSDSAAA